MSREDPKPGRWILPLVVLGIVGFTYAFVNAIPPAPVTTTTPGATPGTTLAPGDASTTTTTTLDPVISAFLAELDTLDARAADLLAEAQQINDDWDNLDSTFEATEAAFLAYETDVADFAAEVEAATPPVSVSSWTAATGAANAMATAAVNMREGFQDPDSAAGRRSGLADLQAAGAQLADALATARSDAEA